MIYIIDRFEENLAILEDEDRKMLEIEREILPKEAKEGDCIKKTEKGYEIDETETAKRRGRIHSLMNQLFE